MNPADVTALTSAFDLSKLTGALVQGAPFILAGAGILIVVSIVFAVYRKVTRKVARS